MASLLRKSMSAILLVVCLVISTPLAGSAGSTNSQIYYETKYTDGLGTAASYYGSAIDTDGDWAVVGAYGTGSNSGTALVYQRVDSRWVYHQYLIPDDLAADMRFGFSVAISGDTILVGAVYDSTSGNYRQGSVYVYRFNGDIWEFETKLYDYYGEPGDYFGYSVAIDGDTAFIGVERSSPALTGQGTVDIYNYEGGVWVYVQTLTSSNPQVGGRFGYAVVIDGNNALVGVPYEDISGAPNQGCVYVYTNNGSTWIEQQRLTASDGSADDQFGSSVDLQGETVLIGSPMDSSLVASQVGSAYIFTYDATWSEQIKLIASDGGQNGENFGNSVSLFSDLVLVGAPGHTVGGNSYQGAAYIYKHSGTVWTEQAEINASDGLALERFGYAVKLDGKSLWVGAPYANGPAGAACGAVYVYSPPFQVLLPIIISN